MIQTNRYVKNIVNLPSNGIVAHNFPIVANIPVKVTLHLKNNNIGNSITFHSTNGLFADFSPPYVPQAFQDVIQNITPPTGVTSLVYDAIVYQNNTLDIDYIDVEQDIPAVTIVPTAGNITAIIKAPIGTDLSTYTVGSTQQGHLMAVGDIVFCQSDSNSKSGVFTCQASGGCVQTAIPSEIGVQGGSNYAFDANMNSYYLADFANNGQPETAIIKAPNGTDLSTWVVGSTHDGRVLAVGDKVFCMLDSRVRMGMFTVAPLGGCLPTSLPNTAYVTTGAYAGQYNYDANTDSYILYVAPAAILPTAGNVNAVIQVTNGTDMSTLVPNFYLTQSGLPYTIQLGDLVFCQQDSTGKKGIFTCQASGGCVQTAIPGTVHVVSGLYAGRNYEYGSNVYTRIITVLPWYSLITPSAGNITALLQAPNGTDLSTYTAGSTQQGHVMAVGDIVFCESDLTGKCGAYRCEISGGCIVTFLPDSINVTSNNNSYNYNAITHTYSIVVANGNTTNGTSSTAISITNLQMQIAFNNKALNDNGIDYQFPDFTGYTLTDTEQLFLVIATQQDTANRNGLKIPIIF
jgi:hypothetical protein